METTHHPKRKREPDDFPPDPHDDDHDLLKRDERATALAKEGQLSDACTALLDEAPGAYSETVAKEMCDRHCGSLDGKRGLPVAPITLATPPPISLVQEALLSFAPDSAARASGLRPQHNKGRLIPGHRRAGASSARSAGFASCGKFDESRPGKPGTVACAARATASSCFVMF